MTYYYAVIDVNSIVTDAYELDEEVSKLNWIPIDSCDIALIGL